MDTLAFISKYEAVLKSKKIPKMQFYKDCGITDAAVSQWRKGKTNPAMTTISRISEYLEVSVAYLLGEEEQKEKPATEIGNRQSEIDFIFSQLTPSRQSKLLELARLYLDDQRKNEET